MIYRGRNLSMVLAFSIHRPKQTRAAVDLLTRCILGVVFSRQLVKVS